MEPHPVYNSENKNKLPPRSPGKCKSHTPTNTGKQQQCLKIYWESRAHKQGAHLCESERKKVRVGMKVELSSKQSQTPPPPPQTQVI